MNDAQAMGRAINSERVALGLTRQELADQVGMSVDSLGEYIRGEREPSLEKLRALAGVLRCTLGYLIGRQEQILGWEKPTAQSIIGNDNIQVSGSTSSSGGDASADNQGLAIAGATVFGDVIVKQDDDDGDD